MKNIQYAVVLGATLLLGAAEANAAHWVNLPEGSFFLKPYETKSIHLDGCNHRVEKIRVRAKSDGLHHCDANIEVFTNYDYYHLKGNVEAKGYPTDTLVDIDGNTQTIVLKNNSNVPATILSVSIQGYQERGEGGYCPTSSCSEGECREERHHRGGAHGLAGGARHLVGRLEAYATDRERIEYLTPIKKAADRAWDSANVRPALSGKLRNRVVALKDAVDDAEDFIDENLEKSAVEREAMRLDELGERLDVELY